MKLLYQGINIYDEKLKCPDRTAGQTGFYILYVAKWVDISILCDHQTHNDIFMFFLGGFRLGG